MKATDFSVNTGTVTVDVCLGGEKAPLGILADAVKEVFEPPYDANRTRLKSAVESTASLSVVWGLKMAILLLF